MEIINFLASRHNKRSDKELVFFQDGQELRVTHAQFDERADALAVALAAAGLVPGDHVGIIARNSAEWALLDLACVKGRFVTAGFEYGRFPFSAALADKYALKAVYLDPSAGADPASGSGVIDLGPIVRRFALAAGDHPVPAGGALAAPVRYRSDDVTTIKFTSGSTGEPKGLAATVGSIDSSINAVQSIFAHDDGDNLLVFLPLSLLQQRYWIYSALAYGHQVTVTSYEFALEIARRAGPTVVMGVPGFFDSVRKMVEVTAPEARQDPVRRRREIEQYLGTAVRYLWTGSAPANPSTLAFFEDAGIAIYEGYGMNETCIVAKNHPGAHKPGSVGKLLPNKRARIDEAGVLVIGSDFPVNTHYAYCGEGDNERIFLPDGEVRTGDLARIDEDGFLYILGRADDVIALGNGKNVYVRSIEEKVKSHESVLDCVLYGAGKPYLVAVLSVAPGDAGRAAVQAHIKQVNAGLPPAERIVKTFVAPRAFTVEDGLLTSQFKPKRKSIYQTYASEIEQLFGT
jgi:long-subunit acyl-CoA synthetase (AMP-forming)